MDEKKQIEEIDELTTVLYEANHKKSVLDYRWLATEIYNANYRKLPCTVGQKVWCIYNYTKPKEFEVAIVTTSKNHYAFTIETKDGLYKHYCDKDAVGKWVFFTKEEAENALRKGGAE